MAEHRFCKPTVVGSTPTLGSIGSSVNQPTRAGSELGPEPADHRTDHHEGRSVRGLLAVGVTVMLAACVSETRSDESQPSRPTPSAQPATSAAPAGPSGPLAVVRGISGGDFARTEGVLRITSGCVMLERSNGETWLLVWGSDQTSWDEEAEEIVFNSSIPGRETVRVHDGQFVELGGSGEFFAEQAPDPEAVPWDEWVTRFDWVAEPARVCAVTGYWSVGGIAPLDQ